MRVKHFTFIWYLSKSRNNKLGIDRDPLKLIRYTEGECQPWFLTNALTTDVIPPQVLRL